MKKLFKIGKFLWLLVCFLTAVCLGVGGYKIFSKNNFSVDSIINRAVDYIANDTSQDKSQTEENVVVVKAQGGDTWVLANWYNIPTGSREHYWEYNGNLYYSFNQKDGCLQYKLNSKTNTFETVIWNGYGWIDGEDIWQYKGNCYYSCGSNHYVFNEETETWQPIVWNGLVSFDGRHVWFCGNDCFYSNGNEQYKLNFESMTWEPYYWGGLTNFYGEYVWSYYGKYYYSAYDEQYILNSAHTTWNKNNDPMLYGTYGIDYWFYDYVMHCYSPNLDENGDARGYNYVDSTGKWNTEPVNYWQYDIGCRVYECSMRGRYILVYNNTCYYLPGDSPFSGIHVACELISTETEK